jgi:hypothetical protein
MGPGPDSPDWHVALRRCVLAVSLLDGVDAVPQDGGVLLEGAPPVEVPWPEVVSVVGDSDPDSATARRRLRSWLRLRRGLADLPDPGTAARPLGLPVGHVLHPGPTWVRLRVLGGALDVGTGFLGLLDDPDEVVVVPAEVVAAAGLDEGSWWPRCVAYLEQMGAVAADRHGRDPSAPLRPMGDCDVVTLLASSAFRAELSAHDPTGLRTAAVPMRNRGWLDLARIDPAFATAAAAATSAPDRGFERPILVTADEVVMAASGGLPAQIELRDPVATALPWKRR